jgi:predicted secreted hydrolase
MLGKAARAWPALAILSALLSFACATAKSPGGAEILAGEASYEALGLSRDRVEAWEDGMRTDGGRGSFEWWYFDSKLDDGSTMVIIFYTKNPIKAEAPLDPWISFELTRPDGAKVTRERRFRPSDFSASKEGCDIRMGSNSLRGDLRDYSIRLELDGVVADLSLHGTQAAWRPGTGHMVFKSNKDRYFAWLPAVPQGRIEGSLRIDGRSEEVRGLGYHDHNWGDASMLELMHDWYWGRAQIGDYSVIAAYIVASDKFGGGAGTVFMLSRNGVVVADDGTKVRFSAEGISVDERTRKPVADKLVYDYDDGKERYRITFQRERDLANVLFIERAKGLDALLARLAGFDGAYMRFTGKATVERLEGGELIEKAVQDAAVWELMYFGHAPKP